MKTAEVMVTDALPSVVWMGLQAMSKQILRELKGTKLEKGEVIQIECRAYVTSVEAVAKEAA